MKDPDNISLRINDNDKALTVVGAFFIACKWLIISKIAACMQDPIGAIYFEIIACFKFEIEHEDLHRNQAKNNALYPTAHKQLRRVVVKCSVWWYCFISLL